MLQVLAIACGIVALVSFVAAVWLFASAARLRRFQEAGQGDESSPYPGDPSPRPRDWSPIALLAASAVFAALAIAAAALDADDDGDGDAAGRAAVRSSVAADIGMSTDDHNGFTRISHVHSGPLAYDLCLGRFYTNDRVAGPWWTDCGTARSLDTIAQARRRLALKHEWGIYNRRAEYVVPAGTDVTYAYGEIAPQCHTGSQADCRRYRGGGVQYWFRGGLDPEADLQNKRCANPGKRKLTDPPSRAKYGRC